MFSQCWNGWLTNQNIFHIAEKAVGFQGELQYTEESQGIHNPENAINFSFAVNIANNLNLWMDMNADNIRMEDGKQE